MTTLTKNKKAYFDYEIKKKYEAGLNLTGQEVKSVKMGRASLKGAYVVPGGSDLYLVNATIPAYQPMNAPLDYNPERRRKLLLHQKQINHLIGKSKETGLTLVPLMLYTKKGRIKLELGVGKGKKEYKKKEKIKKRQVRRKIRRSFKKEL